MPLRVVILSVLLAVAPRPAHAAQIFHDSFADTSGGWTRDPDWEIGPAVGLPGYISAWYDAPRDRSPGADNGLAGTVIGGYPSNEIHDYYYLTSPAIDLGAWPGAKEFSFWHWISTWYTIPDVDVIVEAWNGVNWQVLWDPQVSSIYTLDSEWRPERFDISAFTNSDFRVRFGFRVTTPGYYGSLGIGGWSLDDVSVTSLADCVDADGDGYYAVACGGMDDDDSNPAVHPLAGEICDDLDNDCDGEVDEGVQTAVYPDADGDGYGDANATATLVCSIPPGFVPDNTDCDDLHAEVNLYAGEICDGLDNNCNGYVDEWVAVENFLDADGDGYGDPGSVILSCSPIEGRILRGGDCDDADPSIHPGATELLNDRDDDCDGAVDEDFPAQRIRFIRDVPNDQGRAVRLRWRRHMNEILPNYLQGPAFVATYIVFRRVEPGQAQAMRARPEGHQPQSLPPGEWDIVATVPAMNDSAYQVVVPTLCDSNSTGFCRSTFFVRAQWEESYGVFFEDSAPDSGYSVDNIAPGVPQGFLASAQRSGNQLSWTAELPEDFQYFRLYRSTDPGFTPGPATLLRSTIDSHWLDPAGGAFTYKLTSVDANGNESEAAVASTTLGVSGRPLATTLSFSTLGPNPFRSTLALSFDVPRDRIDVTLTVHDLAGRRVRTLARGSYAAGRNSVTWDGRADDGRPLHAGVYLLRLTGDGRSATRQVTYVP